METYAVMLVESINQAMRIDPNDIEIERSILAKNRITNDSIEIV